MCSFGTPLGSCPVGHPEATRRRGRGLRDRGRLLSAIGLIVLVAVFAVGTTPSYLSYAQEARATEAKLLAGALWTAVMGSALGSCGNAWPVSAGFARAGLDSTGATTPPRWAVSGGGSRILTVECATGAFNPHGDVFTLVGTARDVSAIRVRAVYSSAATPPLSLSCSKDSGASFADC